MTETTEPLVAFVIPLVPIPKGRVRVTKSGAYTDPKTRSYEESVGLFARQAMRGIECNDLDDLAVEAVFYLDTRQRKDIDNLLKSLFDGCNKIVWRDDAQITQVTARIDRSRSVPSSTTVKVSVVNARPNTCQNCGVTLDRRQATLNQSYCSKTCYDTSQRAGIYRACTGCGQPVYRQNGKASAKQVFCSPDCRATRHGRCRNCGALMSDAPTSSNVNCSAECSREWHKTRKTASPADLTGSCTDCGRPCSRHAKRCRGCFLYSRRRVLVA